MSVKQTAGRDALGAFAPKFAELNDDVLFGQVWNRTDKLLAARPLSGHGNGADGPRAGRFVLPLSPDHRQAKQGSPRRKSRKF